MPGRRTRSYTLEEVTMIVIDVPDSDISDFEGKDGGDASDMLEPSLDSGDLNNQLSNGILQAIFSFSLGFR